MTASSVGLGSSRVWVPNILTKVNWLRTESPNVDRIMFAKCLTGNRTARGPPEKSHSRTALRCRVVRSLQSGLRPTNCEIRALFAHFEEKRLEFLCNED
jgi:hypothetical protein